MTPVRALLLALLLAAAPATAGDLDEMRALADQGAYREAAALGARLGSPESLALAAGALSLYGHYVASGAERTAVLREAVALAGRARSTAERLKIADQRVLGLLRFQEGQALGRLAESLPGDEREEYADPVREAFEAALGHDPSRWEAHAGLATWHAKVMLFADDTAGGIGALFANMLFDATYEEAEAHRAAAAAIAKPPSHEMVFRLESAETLLLLDAEENREAARRELEASQALDPVNHLGGLVQARAAACLADLAACAARLKAQVVE